MADKFQAIPVPTPETQHFWDAAKAGELKLQRCKACAHTYFPPRPFCPECASRNVEIYSASGKATLFSYVINHRAPKGWDSPYSIAVVALEEGPRMMTNIINVEQTPEALELDMALEVCFEQVSDDIFLPKFKPAGGAS
ncbi:MAG: putative OB-fold protein [Oceanicoccus sp.]|jgi:uncharacterized OB-fold protein